LEGEGRPEFCQTANPPCSPTTISGFC
jgi:hypothetical protein